VRAAFDTLKKRKSNKARKRIAKLKQAGK